MDFLVILLSGSVLFSLVCILRASGHNCIKQDRLGCIGCTYEIKTKALLIHYIKEHSLNDLKKGCNEVDGDFAFINCFKLFLILSMARAKSPNSSFRSVFILILKSPLQKAEYRTRLSAATDSLIARKSRMLYHILPL